MKENVEMSELGNSLNNIKNLTEKLTRSINNINMLIEDNINSGVGVWDSTSAGLFRTRWENMMEEIPQVLETFKSQEANLESVLQNIKPIEEEK